MNDIGVRRILRALAMGIDPVSGSELDASSPLQAPTVIRALYRAFEIVGMSKRPPPNNFGKPWTAEQEEMLEQEFDKGARPSELARQFGRTRGAIESRLVKLGKIKPRPWSTGDGSGKEGQS